MTWETVIGLEVHCQLATRSKLFSGALTEFGAPPNTQACAVDLALPGVLPVLNREAVAMAVTFGLAIGAQITPRSVFARKNYFYPDLPKGYQISQYELPIVAGGQLDIGLPDGTVKRIRITRAHLEEDAGKSLHEDFQGQTGIDLNRAGTPLIEIVSEPELSSAAEAVAYLKKLHALVRYLEISDANMQEGSFRCDANVSVRQVGDSKLGTRAEIKNINSFRFVERAINVEIERQIERLESGGRVVQETRLYDADRNETRAMRGKEEANDYRYFPDPDLLPVEVSAAWLDELRAALPELPAAKHQRFMDQHGLSSYDADLLTAERELADYFEAVLANGVDAKLAANWINGELAAALNRDDLPISAAPIGTAALAGLLRRISDNTLSGKMAKDVFAAMWLGEGDADRIIDARGLRQLTDSGAIESAVAGVLAANPEQVEQLLSGKDKVLGFLVGQVMKTTAGKANPAQVNQLIRQKLGL
ncbi:MAG: Asp-tRNA(Asn)/Glu-tRNA(Gln) amidotransferase subunit GatB [Immundisolibacter sp.]|uniref:Asp-tRNA(Asn)/Glu-tRNA(Gln) amidotransferase subunit GatB n=1 Tax=Immundisolibacter sp. TaxID=1934948 RepID=UPI003563991C